MNWLTSFASGLKSLFQRRRVERELDEELESYLEESASHKQSHGMTADAARRAALVEMGGPLGKTKRVGPGGIADVSNEMGAFTVVRAESHEAAARMFENHPHFAIFPGEAVEIMPVLPIPGG